jgi:hypothetical protein
VYCCEINPPAGRRNLLRLPEKFAKLARKNCQAWQINLESMADLSAKLARKSVQQGEIFVLILWKKPTFIRGKICVTVCIAKIR